jgi:hypothetical protein
MRDEPDCVVIAASTGGSPVLRGLQRRRAVGAEAAEANLGRGLGQLTAGDWIGALLALAGACGLLLEGLFWIPSWEGMYQDFGALAVLPGFTRLALWRPFTYLAGLAVLGCLFAGLAPRGRGLGWRRAWIVGGFSVAGVALGFLEWALRLPMWQLARALEA